MCERAKAGVVVSANGDDRKHKRGLCRWSAVAIGARAPVGAFLDAVLPVVTTDRGVPARLVSFRLNLRESRAMIPPLAEATHPRLSAARRSKTNRQTVVPVRLL